jgi:hypothetical protein
MLQKALSLYKGYDGYIEFTTPLPHLYSVATLYKGMFCILKV